jgi:radical SAM-linked protein
VNDLKYKYSLTFRKEGLLIFLSQLDLMRLLARALQKSGLPVAYSQGFNPHPRYALPYPLPVGYTGTAEILELYLTRPLPETGLAARLNEYLPDGVCMTGAVPGSLQPAYYLRVLLEAEFSLPENWPELVLTKETKRGRVEHFRLGEHMQLALSGRELYITPLGAVPLRAEKICALLGLAPEQIAEIIREAR